MSSTHLAKITYDAPPLVEVAMSVQFLPPRDFHVAHFGIFWESVRAKYPKATVSPPINSIPDDFGNERRWLPRSLRFALSDVPECRLQMTSEDDCWMCQLQQDRLVVNWRKRSDNSYPRYDAAWIQFESLWVELKGMLLAHGHEEPKPQFWELLYVNRIPQGNLWETPQQWPDVFPRLWPHDVKSVAGAPIHGLLGQWIWQTNDGLAKIIVEPKPARDSDQDVLFMTITSRGPVVAGTDENSTQQIALGLERGHSLIVSTFDEIISDSARAAWGRR